MIQNQKLIVKLSASAAVEPPLCDHRSGAPEAKASASDDDDNGASGIDSSDNEDEAPDELSDDEYEIEEITC